LVWNFESSTVDATEGSDYFFLRYRYTVIITAVLLHCDACRLRSREIWRNFDEKDRLGNASPGYQAKPDHQFCR